MRGEGTGHLPRARHSAKHLTTSGPHSDLRSVIPTLQMSKPRHRELKHKAQDHTLKAVGSRLDLGGGLIPKHRSWAQARDLEADLQLSAFVTSIIPTGKSLDHTS